MFLNLIKVDRHAWLSILLSRGDLDVVDHIRPPAGSCIASLAAYHGDSCRC